MLILKLLFFQLLPELPKASQRKKRRQQPPKRSQRRPKRSQRKTKRSQRRRSQRRPKSLRRKPKSPKSPKNQKRKSVIEFNVENVLISLQCYVATIFKLTNILIKKDKIIVIFFKFKVNGFFLNWTDTLTLFRNFFIV